MKTLLCACTLLCAFNLKAASVPSIVVVDMEAIIAHHPNTPNDKKLLEDTLAEFSQERDALRAAIKAKQADLEKQVQEAQNPMIAPAKAEELRKACEAKFREIQRDTDAAEQKMASRSRELSDLEDRLLKRTTKEIQAHIAAYSKEKGFQVVLYKNMVPYVTPERDITDLIIILCGGKPEPKDTSKGADELKPAATLEDSLPIK
ncbi:MAG: OmpH family outer membrane protein [Candidatus Spyradenecus sp.]